MKVLGKHSLRRELFAGSAILSAVFILVFGLLFSGLLFYSGRDNAYAVLREKNRALNYYISGYFTKIRNAVDFLSRNQKIVQAASLPPEDQAEVLDLYRSLESADSDINYIYSGYEDGSLLINNYTPPAGYNPMNRPWYQSALAVEPEITDGIPYQEIKTREWLVSLSRVLLDQQDRLQGVVAIDCSIQQMESMLHRPADNYRSSYSFVTKPDGEILIHYNTSLLGKKASTLFGRPVAFDGADSDLSKALAVKGKIAYYSRIDPIGWIVVTVIDEDEILLPIAVRIGFSLLSIGVISLFLGWIFSALFSRRIAVPLIELKQRINGVIRGNHRAVSDYNYPQNEIGLIARDIQKLTESELYNKNLELQQVNRELEVLSTTDQLTGLFNRRKMQEELRREYQRARRYQRSFILMIFDVDWFKGINDSYGHPAGDRVLEELSELTRASLRTTDIIARWGGEEFLVLSPELDREGGAMLAEKLCSAVGESAFSVGSRVTISIGVSEFDNKLTLDQIISAADRGLYQAKAAGRNRVALSWKA